MRKTAILPLAVLVGMLAAGCASNTRYFKGFTPEGFPVRAKYSQDGRWGTIRVGPFREITIEGEDYPTDCDRKINSMIISYPPGYPMKNKGVMHRDESHIPEEHPLSKYAIDEPLQRLFDKLRMRSR